MIVRALGSAGCTTAGGSAAAGVLVTRRRSHFRKPWPADLEQLARLVHHWPLHPGGTEGYPKAEVTVGGIDTSESSSKTMEARARAPADFIGALVDVTGWLGVYLQWAGPAATPRVRSPNQS